MRIKRGLLLAMIILMSAGGYTPSAVAANASSTTVEGQQDDGMGPVEAQAADDSGDDESAPVARYLVTFLKSRTTDPLRSATVVSVTNQAGKTCRIAVEWVRGFEPPAACTTTVRLEPGITTDLCSRGIPTPLTTCNGCVAKTNGSERRGW